MAGNQPVLIEPQSEVKERQGKISSIFEVARPEQIILQSAASSSKRAANIFSRKTPFSIAISATLSLRWQPCCREHRARAPLPPSRNRVVGTLIKSMAEPR
jgi:hypothetical protein